MDSFGQRNGHAPDNGSGKLRFLLVTFVVTAAVVFGMVAADSFVAGGGDHATTLLPAETAPRQPEPAAEGQPEGKVVTAQRVPERDLQVPPAQKGPDPALYLPNIADIAERANGAVVNIRATEIIRAGTRERRANPHDPFEFFFPRPDDRSPRGDSNDDDQRQDSGGSGFVVSSDGFILTNYHVIEDADKIVVRLAGESRDYDATVIGTDQLTDLALLKIDAGHPLPTIPLGDSEGLRVGEWVIAIGNPLVYDHTVTVGVVSAKGRKLVGLSRDVALDNYIQTDAAINRGNSGGPLLNVRGEAIGINSAISVAGQGISFAIPINMARDVMSQLREKGKVDRGFLGVTIQDIQTELRSEEREYFGLQNRQGAFIQSVTDGNPAAVAGLKPGDAIVSVDGRQITSSDDLIRTISSKTPGARVSLGVIRDGRERKITAELTNRPDPVARASRDDSTPAPDQPASDYRLGITVEDLTADTRQELRVDPDVRGVIVTHVSQVSDAWERGLREGDVITEVNRQKIGSLAEYRALVDKLGPGDIMALYVTTPGVGIGRFVTIRVGAE